MSKEKVDRVSLKLPTARFEDVDGDRKKDQIIIEKDSSETARVTAVLDVFGDGNHKVYKLYEHKLQAGESLEVFENWKSAHLKISLQLTPQKTDVLELGKLLKAAKDFERDAVSMDKTAETLRAQLVQLQKTNPTDKTAEKIHMLDELDFQLLDLENWLCVHQDLNSNLAIQEFARAKYENTEDLERRFYTKDGKEGLYAVVKAIRDSNAYQAMNPEDKRWIDLKIQRLEGKYNIDKDPKILTTIEAKLKEAEKLQSTFRENIAADSRSIKIPIERFKSAFIDNETSRRFIDSHITSSTQTEVVVNTDSDWVDFMKYCKDRALKEDLYNTDIRTAYDKNKEVLPKFLNALYQAIVVLPNDHRFTSIAAYELANNLLDTPKKVIHFITDRYQKVRPRAEAEYKELTEEFKLLYPEEGEIKPWDRAFIERSLKEKKEKFDEDIVRPYFEYESTMFQLLKDAEAMSGGFKFQKLNPSEVAKLKQEEQVESWDPSVIFYKIIDPDSDKPTGVLALDMFARDHKSSRNAAAYPVRTPDHKKRNKYLLVLKESVPNPKFSKDGKTYLTPWNVSSIAHELGHIANYLRVGQKIKHADFSKFTEKDAQEFPSVAMEGRIYSDEFLDKVKHAKTQQPMPQPLREKLRAARRGFGYYLGINDSMLAIGLQSVKMYDANPTQITNWADFAHDTKAPYAFLLPEKKNDTWLYTSNHTVTSHGNFCRYSLSSEFADDLEKIFDKYGYYNPILIDIYGRNLLSLGGAVAAQKQLDNFYAEVREKEKELEGVKSKKRS